MSSAVEPRITRVRHEPRRRRLTVAKVQPRAPKMLRVVLTGEDLAHFNSLGFDDHVKVFFSEEPPVSRDFTPRYFNAGATGSHELIADEG